MRKGRPKYPQPREVGPVIRALQLHIPVDAPLMLGMRESLKHVPNYRIRGITGGIEWMVDVYRSGFCHVQVQGGWSEQFKAIPPLVTYLKLRLKNNQDS